MHILQKDSDVLVPVTATLLVVEAQGVQQLVLDSVVVDAALTTQRQGLTIAKTTHIGVTPAIEQHFCIS